MAHSFWKPVALIAMSGCYQYVPANQAALAATTPVSVELSARGSANVTSKIGSNVSAVQGDVTESSPSALTLAIRAVRRRGENTLSTWSGESITLAPEDIDEVKTRQLSRGRTAGASAALIAASVGLVVGVAKATGGASGSSGGRPTPTP